MNRWTQSVYQLITFIVLGIFLSSTAISAQESGTITGTVQDKNGEPLSGVTVLVVESQQKTTTGAQGQFTLRVAPGERTLLATRSGYELAEKRFTVEAGSTATADFTLGRSLAQFGEELVVVGSRVTRSALETPVPVDVLGEEDIVDTGMVETSRIIQFLAPSFNHSTSTISDGTDIVRPSTLRGLGPDQTLVLINGKRRHTSALVHVNGSVGRGTAGTDLNAIPASAIERIEILRDGASAQYGSDAIAGVINIVLRTATDKTNVTLNGGQHFAGDGENFQASVNHGFRLAETGYLNITAEYRDRGFTNRAGQDPRRIFNFLEQERGQPALSAGTPDPREETFDRLNHRYGDAESENAYLFLNSSIPLSESTELYFFGGVSQREGTSGGFYRLPSQGRTNTFIHPEGHLPFINTNVDDLSLSFGFNHRFENNWSLDASVTTGGNDFEFVITNSANTSLGPNSPDQANAGELSFDQTTINLDFLGLVGTSNLAFGAEYREDSYAIEAGEPASWIDGGFPDQFGGRAPAGIQVFPGFRPSNEVDESRDSVALYGDFETVVADKLTIGLAARYEDFSDFGDTLTGKLALRYAVSERFALRGSASTGFRAPSLHQQFFNNTSTQFVLVGSELVPLEVGTFRNDSGIVEAFGVPKLEEETSVNFSGGFVYRPRKNLSITADVFQIDIDDRIVISGLFRASNPQIAPLLDPFGVSAAQFFTNAIDTETTGVDLVVAYFRELSGGARLQLTGAANWNETEVVGDARTPAPLAGLGETLFDRRERAFIERGQPRELYNLALKYNRGRYGVQLRLNKFGSVVTVESPANPDIDQTFSGKWLTDLDFSYELRKGIRFSVGGNNIFDVFPDRNRPEISFNGIFPYPRRTAPFGFNGGYYYARLSFNF